MSISVMSWVWKHSPAKGVELLIELALADYADDNGRCWPGEAAVATKARCTDRWVRATVAKLVGEGRLLLDAQAGPYGTNVYTFARKPVPPEVSSTRNSVARGAELDKEQSSTDPSITTKDPSAPLPNARTRRRDVSADDLAALTKAHPSLDVAREWEKAQDYLRADGKSKKDNLAFLRNWLRRAEDERRIPAQRTAANQRNAATSAPRSRAAEARRLLGL